MDYHDLKPIVRVDETSDDDVVNLYIDVVQGAAIVHNMDPEWASEFEMLINRGGESFTFKGRVRPAQASDGWNPRGIAVGFHAETCQR